MKTIPFDYEKYKNEGYEVVTRGGRKVEQLQEFKILKGVRYCGVVNDEVRDWYINGNYYLGSSNDLDLFLLAKPVERWCSLYANGYTSDTHIDKASLICHSASGRVAFVKFTFSDDTCNEPLTVELIKP